ncbi:MAG: hypothetical protein LBP56_07460 [Odoribacteraceae bacterium]|jgi:hypothetical protein|nr:hypothetical protein [Odoribacteraceae bacterium]
MDIITTSELNSFTHIARHTSRMIVRTALFRCTVVLYFCMIVFVQLYVQGNVFAHEGFARTSLSSFVPCFNIYLLTGLLLLPVTFITHGVLRAGVKYHSHEVFYARPEGNVTYILGIACGILRVFMIVGVGSLGVAAFIHLFCSYSPFDGGIYLFYLFAWWFPSLVVITGLSLLAGSAVRHQGAGLFLSLFILLITCYLSVYGESEVIDPFGINLPNAFSDVTGLMNAGGYLLQRAGWLLAGAALVAGTVLLFRRLPNRPRVRGRMGVFVILLVVAWVACLAYPLHSRHLSGRARSLLVATHEKYNDRGKLALLQADITCTREGKRIRATSRMVVQNRTGGVIERPVLYLNPALEVRVLAVNGADTPFERENQVIVPHVTVPPGDSLVINVEYGGGVAETIYSLDAPGSPGEERRRDPYSASLFGKNRLFLEKDFTLLLPGCLWYPVTIPPVNPALPYDIQKNFTGYTLKVVAPGGLMAISQGERSSSGDTILFRDATPLTGLSLCIGPYTRYAVSTRQGELELYLFKGHESLLNGLESLRDTLPRLLEGMITGMEAMYGHAYPFHHLKLVETPVSFFTRYRHERGHGERVQPGLLFFPERAVSLPSAHFAGLREWTRRDSARFKAIGQDALMTETGLLQQFIRRNFTDEYDDVPTFYLDKLIGKEHPREKTLNPCNVTAWFFHHVYHLYSPGYPVMDVLFQHLARQAREDDTRNAMSTGYSQEAIDYLNRHSLREAIRDRALPPDVLHEIFKLKATDFKNRFISRDLSGEMVTRYALEQVRPFQRVDFEEFNRAFMERHGADWRTVLSEWYDEKQLPAFWVSDFRVNNVTHDGPEYLFNIEFKAYNDSDVDGVISLVLTLMRDRGGMEQDSRGYVIPARQGRHISLVYPGGELRSFAMNTHLSRNIPRAWPLMRSRLLTTTSDTVQRELPVAASYFLPGPGKIVVDNMEENCRAYHDESTRFLTSLKFKKNSIRPNVVHALNDAWSTYINMGSYGGYRFTFAAKRAGNGKARIEWETEIPRPGEYELFTYISPVPLMIAPSISATYAEKYKETGTGIPKPPFNQHYTVSHDNGSEARLLDLSALDIDVFGSWISLGHHHLPGGRCKVTLSDKGDPDYQIIYADAIKWEATMPQ